MAHVLNISQSPLRIFTDLRELKDRFSAAWTLHRAYRRTRAELEALSDRDLEDIGVSRANLADIARAHTYGA